ncbi:carboxymuconolactone decarboxylase family protein [uncultured Parasphingopyxis sp.]|uniref:carboxymuconolactone decarboxylase family protein n=1 Tax=uncultured Parasphingopyxis sp. TaxID=1547918 RepID=UPI002634ACFE|nr:carboxymuconolactone decarboxylase family protein [uncultured Parasphingopyxis sp.]
MPRLRQVSRAEADESVLPYYDRLFGDRDPVAEPGTATGTPGDWWTTYALSPHVFEHAVSHFGMFGMFSNENVSTLPGDVRELGILRAGYVAGSQFVFSQHCKAARKNGLSEEKIRDVTDWQVSDVYDENERALLAYADAIVLERGRVSDGLFAAVKKALSDENILEFTYHVIGYVGHATMCRALKLEYDNVEERIREVPAPDGGGLAADWAGSAWNQD